MVFTQIAVGLIVDYLIRNRMINNGVLMKAKKGDLIKFAQKYNIDIDPGETKKNISKTIYSHYSREIKRKKITFRKVNDIKKSKNLILEDIIKYNLGNGLIIFTGKVKNLKSKKSLDFVIKARTKEELLKKI